MKKILIVDDDADIREIIVSVLSGKYELRQAGGKKEAVKTFDEFKPDLVILDVMMDTMTTGFELAREFKKGGAAPTILLLTSVDKETDIDFKAEAGNLEWLPVDGYLTKPLVPKVLLEKVKALLEGKGAVSSSRK
jgi:two-component system, OmpR family, response regulator ResD